MFFGATAFNKPIGLSADSSIHGVDQDLSCATSSPPTQHPTSSSFPLLDLVQTLGLTTSADLVFDEFLWVEFIQWLCVSVIHLMTLHRWGFSQLVFLSFCKDSEVV